MLIEQQKRSSRVRFNHPVRVVTLDGQPRVIRTLTANVSHKGMFVRMPEPLPMGTRVALSLEAGGRALALAQAEVVWARSHESRLPGRFAGCGVKFTGFLHPRAEDLVEYLVGNLDRGKPLLLAPTERSAPKWFGVAAAAVLVILAAGAALVFSESDAPDELEDVAPSVVPRRESAVLVAGAPVVTKIPSPVAATAIPGDGAASGADKVAADKVAADKVAADKVAADKVAADKVAADKVAADKVAADKVAADKVAADKVAADKVAADKVAADKVAADKPAAQKRTSRPSPQPLSQRETGSQDDLAASVDPKALEQSGRTGRISLPSGATTGLNWAQHGTNLVLDPGASLSRAFLLTNPARAVFDLEGPAPKKTVTLPAAGPHMQSVRLGKLPNGTRIVVDLDEMPRSAKQADGTLVLTY